MMDLQAGIVRPLNYISDMRGDWERSVTPLDQFYLHILELWRYRVLVVRFDKTKIRISLQDAKILFDHLRDFIEHTHHCHAHDATISAIRTWEAVGPQIDCDVTPGTLILDEGYMLIRLEDLAPGIAFGSS